MSLHQCFCFRWVSGFWYGFGPPSRDFAPVSKNDCFTFEKLILDCFEGYLGLIPPFEVGSFLLRGFLANQSSQFHRKGFPGPATI